MSFVLDCSMTMAWIFEDEATARTMAVQDTLLDQSAVVPSLWPIEVANVLLMATKRKRIKMNEWPNLLEQLSFLPIIQDDQTFEQATQKSLKLAHQYGLSVYDAVYLELASRKNIPLATLDKALGLAAKKMKVALL